jgi:type VI protein secretion system component VasK
MIDSNGSRKGVGEVVSGVLSEMLRGGNRAVAIRRILRADGTRKRRDSKIRTVALGDVSELNCRTQGNVVHYEQKDMEVKRWVEQ